MKEILIHNQEILDRLNGFLTTIQSLDQTFLKSINRDPSISPEHAVSQEYLDEIMNKKNIAGWPLAINGLDVAVVQNLPPEWNDLKNDICHTFTRELGCQQNALCCYYPSDGYIGWHDNHDCPGHTILFNWSETGSGFYRYRDVDTGEIVTIQDRPGWSCKTGYYGDGKDTPRQYHCALANEPRWSIAFYIRSQDMVDMIREEIEYSDS
jgi:hypothetical protein